MVSARAKREHAFTNRTGRLEASIAPVGRLTAALIGLRATEVQAPMHYGSYVEENYDGKYAYLGPAASRSEDEMSAEFTRAMERAIDRAREHGWHRG